MTTTSTSQLGTDQLKTDQLNTQKRSAATIPISSRMECGAAIPSGQMAKFVSTFQQSARRWETIVYPALFAFVVLAGYGFFLIFSLTSDMSKMADSMDDKMGEHMASMTSSIVSLSQQVKMMTHTMKNISTKLDTLEPMLQYVGAMDNSMAQMTQSMVHMDIMMTRMDKSMARMDISIGSMDGSIGNMDRSMRSMDRSIHVITTATDQMWRDLNVMNRGISNVTRPMSFANTFMPW